MKTSPILTAVAAALLSVAMGGAALADPPGGHDRGHGKGHDQGYGGGGPPGLAKKAHGMPPGQAKKMWRRGERIPTSYYTVQRYYIVEPVRYRLAPPPPGYRWVLVEDDAYLVRRDNGLISQVVANAVANLLR